MSGGPYTGRCERIMHMKREAVTKHCSYGRPDRLGTGRGSHPTLSLAFTPDLGSERSAPSDDWGDDRSDDRGRREVDDLRTAKGITLCCLAGGGLWTAIGLVAWMVVFR